MTKRVKKILTAVLAVGLCLGMTSCGDANDISSVYLDYGTGIAGSEYNSDLYGMNIVNDVAGSDPGVFYVSEEEDPEYGGWYYMYITGSRGVTYGITDLTSEQCEGLEDVQISTYRSKDLYNWEQCGAVGGRALLLYEDDWVDPDGAMWAPEVIRNPHDGKYYLYFTGTARLGISPDINSEGDNSTANRYYFDRLFLGVSVSDTPEGPFHVISDIDVTTGHKIPTMNFQKAYNTETFIRTLDTNPFFDEDGTLYLYFVRHDAPDLSGNRVCGIKMENMYTPDYSTFSYLTQPQYSTVNFVQGDPTSVSNEGCEPYYMEDVSINEGAFMIKHNGKYYMTYTEGAFRTPEYSVHVAVSDEPLLGFRKLSPEEGGQVCYGGLLENINGTGHHAIVQDKAGSEYWILYHRHDSNLGWDASPSRSISVDRLKWVMNEDGLETPVTNGPTRGLTWLSESVSGYANIAKDANIIVSDGTGAEYVNDEVIPFYDYVADKLCTTEGENLQIVLRWDKPVTVRSVMVYNALDVNKAFSGISEMKFKLAEKPEWASKDYEYAIIRDIKFPERYWDAEDEKYDNCTPVVAEFDEIVITELTITVNGEDRLMSHDNTGTANVGFDVSEIVVLGRNE